MFCILAYVSCFLCLSYSPVAEWMDPDKIRVELDCGLFEAGWSPETHSKNPPINSLGKFFYKQNSKWPLLYLCDSI